jgi:hypothetical protein
VHHIRLDVHSFTELCKSLRMKEDIIIIWSQELGGSATQIVIPASAADLILVKDDSPQQPAKTVATSKPVDMTKFAVKEEKP